MPEREREREKASERGRQQVVSKSNGKVLLVCGEQGMLPRRVHSKIPDGTVVSLSVHSEIFIFGRSITKTHLQPTGTSPAPGGLTDPSQEGFEEGHGAFDVMSLNNFQFIHSIKNSPAVFRRRFKKDKTKNLSHGDPLFKVHYMGMEKIYSLQVEQTREVVNRLVGKESCKASKDHALVVRPRYLEVKEISSGRQITKTYLHDIAYCTADRGHTNIFLYICKSKGQLQCRVFLCNKAEKAKAITVCLAKSFETAFSQWHETYSRQTLPLPSSATGRGSEEADKPHSHADG
ncbi:hypothetical protein scyTo_0022198, partial [Scyliorhinus torazame]|nr:hypothetical protein [Scyliorhinus torazame]